ncbi:hypothetical protein C8J56DRAFT_1164360 [Mycena floridula]|nr:hypothetical protein C8J56DRAFT_1164360 [Mycena floridula]
MRDAKGTQITERRDDNEQPVLASSHDHGGARRPRHHFLNNWCRRTTATVPRGIQLESSSPGSNPCLIQEVLVVVNYISQFSRPLQELTVKIWERRLAPELRVDDEPMPRGFAQTAYPGRHIFPCSPNLNQAFAELYSYTRTIRDLYMNTVGGLVLDRIFDRLQDIVAVMVKEATAMGADTASIKKLLEDVSSETLSNVERRILQNPDRPNYLVLNTMPADAVAAVCV